MLDIRQFAAAAQQIILSGKTGAQKSHCDPEALLCVAVFVTDNRGVITGSVCHPADPALQPTWTCYAQEDYQTIFSHHICPRKNDMSQSRKRSISYCECPRIQEEQFDSSGARSATATASYIATDGAVVCNWCQNHPAG